MSPKVKHPPIGDLSPKVEDFLPVWQAIVNARHKLEVFLTPAVDAIKQYHYGRARSVTCDWEQLEVLPSQNHLWEVVLVFTSYWPGAGEDDHESYVLPLAVALSGQVAITTFFNEEKAKQQKKADELGQQRLMQEKTQRKTIFDKLKLEFEPPVEAIVKYNDNN